MAVGEAKFARVKYRECPHRMAAEPSGLWTLCGQRIRASSSRLSVFPDGSMARATLNEGDSVAMTTRHEVSNRSATSSAYPRLLPPVHGLDLSSKRYGLMDLPVPGVSCSVGPVSVMIDKCASLLSIDVVYLS